MEKFIILIGGNYPPINVDTIEDVKDFITTTKHNVYVVNHLIDENYTTVYVKDGDVIHNINHEICKELCSENL